MKKIVSIIILFVMISVNTHADHSILEEILTLEEIRWLDSVETIQIGIMKDWAPMDFVDAENNPQGVGTEYLDYFNSYLEGKIEIVADSWEHNYDKALSGELDALMDITATKERKVFFDFTNEYVVVPYYIVAQKNETYFKTLESINTYNIAIEKGYFMVNYLIANYPLINVIEYDSTEDALYAVANGEADAYVGNRAVSNYIIQTNQLTNLAFNEKILATESRNGIAVNKELPLLTSILNKLLVLMSDEEKNRIETKWLGNINASIDFFYLTDKEEAFIEEHQEIIVAFDGDYAPYSYYDESGNMVGIAVDFLDEIARRTGLEFTIYEDGNWSKLYNAALEKEVDVIATLVKREERIEYFNFTEAYLSLAQYILTQEGKPFKNIEDISNKKVALVETYSTSKYLLEEYPDIDPLYVSNLTEAMEAVVTGEADATVAAIGSAQHIISRKSIQGLNFAALYSQGLSEQRYGIRKDWPELHSILDKGLASITESERLEIFRRWSTSEVANIEVMSQYENIYLSDVEKKWLSENPVITVGIDPGWAPVEYSIDGDPRGVTMDYLAALEEILNVDFNVTHLESWNDSFDSVVSGETMLLSSATQTDEREAYLIFSEPYLNLVTAIFTDEDEQVLLDLPTLDGQKVALVEGYSINEYIKRNYPNITIVPVENINDGLNKLANGRVDAFIDAMLTTTYAIQKEGFANIKVSGTPLYSFELSFASQKDNTVLIAIIEKAIKVITDEQKNEINRKWRTIEVEGKVGFAQVKRYVFPLAIGLLLLLAWIYKLNAEVRRRTELQKQLSKAKEEAEFANETKSMFLANMSHEIRTPMNAIIGMSYLALQTELDKKQRNYIEKVNRSAESLLGIINDILDFSKIEAGKLEIEKINFRLEDIFDNLSNLVGLKADDKNLELLFDILPELNTAYIGDPLRLSQILVNLGNNAVKFTDEGEVVIGFRIEEENDLTSTLRFYVKDTGIGMSEEQRNNLFGSFSQADTSTTRKYGGTGLGLAISKNLTKLMGGDIWVESEVAKGSVFSFTITLGKQKESSPKRHVNAELKGMRILIVDDNKSAREILSVMLATMGFRVDQAMSGEKSLAMLKEEDSVDPYELILMDWKMPKLDGIETLKRLQSDNELVNLPAIIMVTGFGREEVSKASEGIDINIILTKPVTPSSLLEAIKTSSGYHNASEDSEEYGSKLELSSISKISGAHVLLVEDHPVNIELATELLQSNGITVEVAVNGKIAIELLEKGDFDGILMDCQMPIMDGYTATRIIRKNENYKTLPIIAMTANAMSGDKDKVIEAGMNDHISKPINVNTMFSVMAKWIVPANPTEVMRNIEKESVIIPELDGIDVSDGLKRTDSNGKLYLKLLRKFVKSHGEFINEYVVAVKASDWNLAERLAHTIKGTAGSIGASLLQKACGDLETQAREETVLEESLSIAEKELVRIITSIASLEKKSTVDKGIPEDVTVASSHLSDVIDNLIDLISDYDGSALEYMDSKNKF